MLKSNLRYLREKHNLTIAELATMLGVNSLTVQWWEEDRINPDSKELISIAKYFSVKVDELLSSDLEKLSIEAKKENRTLSDPVKLNQFVKTGNTSKTKVSSRSIVILVGVLTTVFFAILNIFLIWNTSVDLPFFDETKTNVLVEIPEIEVVTGEERFTNAMVSAGRNFSVYMDDDGKLIGYGDNEYQQLNFSNWTDLKEISAGGFHTLGLRNDGTVLATGYNAYGQLNVKQWSQVDHVSAGRYHSLGLKDDGTVLCTGGEKKYAQCDVSSWEDIFQVSAGRYNSYGLKSNGTVITTSDNGYGQANISGWNDIIQVSSGTYHVLGLKSDGTVVCAGGQKGDGACNVSSWSDIVQVVGAGYHSIGLKKDGTVVAVGNNDKGQLNVSSWSNVIFVSGGRYHTIGLTEDFKFLSIGLDNGQSVNNSNTQSTPATGEESEESSTDQTVIKSGEIEYRNIGDNNRMSYQIGDNGNSITNAKFDNIEFRYTFTSAKDNFLVKIKTIDGLEYVTSFVYRNTAANSKGSYLYEEILKVLRVDDNARIGQTLSFSVAERVDDNDISKGYTNWIDIKEKFDAKSDFERLFMWQGGIEIKDNGYLYAIYPGRFDVSRFKTGSDLDLSFGYDYVYLLYNNENYQYGGDKLYLSDVMSRRHNLTWSSNFPDDFEVNKTYYACNSVHSLKEISVTPNLITHCVPFSLSQVKFGIEPFASAMPYGEIKFSYSREWMISKADKTFKLFIEIPDLGYSYDTNLEVELLSGYFNINILDELKGKVTISESTSNEVKVIVKVIVNGVGNYLSSDPLEFEMTLNKEDLSE